MQMSVIKETIPSICKDVENLEVSYIASGNITWGSQFGNCLAVPQQLKHRVAT
jgi:hypothetical protein